MNRNKQKQASIDDDDIFLENLRGREIFGGSLPYGYDDKGNEVKLQVKSGRDSSGNMWQIEGENACWEWGKYKIRNGERELIEESDNSFKTMKECETDAKVHGMDGKFSI